MSLDGLRAASLAVLTGESGVSFGQDARPRRARRKCC